MSAQGKINFRTCPSAPHTGMCILSLLFRQVESRNEHNPIWGKVTYPSFLAHNKLGPKTMAMLLGVILLMSLV